MAARTPVSGLRAIVESIFGEWVVELERMRVTGVGEGVVGNTEVDVRRSDMGLGNDPSACGFEPSSS